MLLLSIHNLSIHGGVRDSGVSQVCEHSYESASCQNDILTTRTWIVWLKQCILETFFLEVAFGLSQVQWSVVWRCVPRRHISTR